MNEKQFTKCFYNERTGETYKTLKAAKESSSQPYIYRCWVQDGNIVAKRAVFSYGEFVCSIRNADEEITKILNDSVNDK